MLWPLLALLIGVLGWTLLFANLEKEKRAAEATAMQEAEVLSRAYATHLHSTLQAIDQIALYVRHGWQTANGRYRLEDMHAHAAPPMISGFYVALIDADGELITSTVPDIRRVNVAGKPYFAAQARSADELYIGYARTGDFTGQLVVPFSRRLSHPDGSFAGIVLVSVVPEHFISGFDEATIGEHGFLGILGMDRRARLSRLGIQVYRPEAPALLKQPAVTGEAGRMALVTPDWFADRRPRYIGWKTTADYGMISLAGIDQEAALAPYREQRRTAIEYGVLASFGLVVLTLLVMFFSWRLAWRKHQFETMQATYRTATESSDEGFFIASPIYDGSGRATDFRVTDCNQRGAELVGYRRHELVGRTISAIYHGQTAELTMKMLRRALRDGSYEGETELASIGLPGPGWIHIRISRPDHDLAVMLRDISEAKAHVSELERRGNHDALTSLPNRHWVQQHLPEILSSAAVQRMQVALLFIDLDGFKIINDTMGHEAGDEVLRHVGRRLKLAIRPHDHVVRIGGDEFLVILESLHAAEDSVHVARRILEAFGPAFRITAGTHQVGTSIGISLFPQDGQDANTLLKNADIAMYSVKTDGKHSYCFFHQSFHDALQERHRKEAELRQALEHDQLVMYYQPRVDVATGATSSMEALVRWAHPTRGIVEPNDFIPLAEETGLIVRLGELVIDKVCAQLAFWSRQGDPLVPVSVNVSPRQFTQTDIARMLGDCLQRHQVDPALLEVELTESSMSGDGDEVARTLSAIQRMGVKLLVDDFGTGYSSLSQLQRLDFDVLKVDRAFTAQLEKTREGTVLFSAIITMAHGLGMRVVAEGVETLEQMRALKALRCDEIQGFLVSRPLPAADLPSRLRQGLVPSML
ncbi:bifunctional diguanylate cyclase/phosphodiesterase [Noviherbaspirillum humi]|uniref:bifunctional diguanylate cyclase/phosphodiesterase n=1 Tax=Noviherbaspirillum humi TaxID=1688639 RepID=UPI001595554B|nr:EAL domain-containing protein [Noviherbaspirillum humi]